MRVTHRHLYRGVPQKFLNRLQGDASHNEVRRERVPQDMPSDATEASFAACSPKGPLALPFVEQLTFGPCEDPLAPKAGR